MKYNITKYFTEFFESERASGIILLLSAGTAMVLANSPLRESFLGFWHTKVGLDLGVLDLRYDLAHWVNDGLMAIFFLLIGLEIERELYVGELADLRKAALPIFAAVGGVILPALIHFSLNKDLPTQSGFGIPMATDIAFALGILALLGKKVPLSLKVFLTAFAIIDDLIAILVIVIFYAGELNLAALAVAGGVFVLLLILNRNKVRTLPVYLLLGLVMWYAILQSGVHASIAGVLLAFAIPFTDGTSSSPSYKLQHTLHLPVAFGIMPIFALANTGVTLIGSSLSSLLTSNTLGIFIGLVAGKPLGITFFSALAIRLKVASAPEDISMRHLLGVGLLGGIGFTMSIFITFLAFGEGSLAQNSKLAIIIGSLTSGLVGYFFLSRQARNQEVT